MLSATVSFDKWFDKWFKAHASQIPLSMAQRCRLVRKLVHTRLQMKRLQSQIAQLQRALDDSRHSQEAYSIACAAWKARVGE